jgi:hypothetical protein
MGLAALGEPGPGIPNARVGWRLVEDHGLGLVAVVSAFVSRPVIITSPEHSNRRALDDTGQELDVEIEVRGSGMGCHHLSGDTIVLVDRKHCSLATGDLVRLECTPAGGRGYVFPARGPHFFDAAAGGAMTFSRPVPVEGGTYHVRMTADGALLMATAEAATAATLDESACVQLGACRNAREAAKQAEATTEATTEDYQEAEATTEATTEDYQGRFRLCRARLPLPWSVAYVEIHGIDGTGKIMSSDPMVSSKASHVLPIPSALCDRWMHSDARINAGGIDRAVRLSVRLGDRDGGSPRAPSFIYDIERIDVVLEVSFRPPESPSLADDYQRTMRAALEYT